MGSDWVTFQTSLSAASWKMESRGIEAVAWTLLLPEWWILTFIYVH